MEVRRRRRRNLITLLVCAVVLAAGLGVASWLGDTERIAHYWASAEVDASGTATITEVIEYDFGMLNRRGIYRDVPDLLDTTVQASSATAPDMFIVEPSAAARRCADSSNLFAGVGQNLSRICIGDPDTEISGRHIYTIQYNLDTLVQRAADTTVDWQGVGQMWTVGIQKAELHVRAPFALGSPTCALTGAGSGSCSVEAIAPGHLRVVHDGLSGIDAEDQRPGTGIRIRATAGGAVPLAVAPPLPDRSGEDPSAGILAVGLAALAGLVALMPLVSRLITRMGRELVWAGGAADAAFGPGNVADGEPRGVVRLDAKQLAEMATIEFVPPKGLAPWQGGMVDREVHQPEHQLAWLVQKAIDGEIHLSGTKELTLTASAEGVRDPFLTTMFDGRDTLVLDGQRDPAFRRGWLALAESQQDFAKESTLWESRGDRRRTATVAMGVAALLLGMVGGVVAAVQAGRNGTSWLPWVVVAAAVAGAGLCALVRAWELRVRTPVGSSAWLRVESFRQFIANSEARHAEWAAEHGLLRDYTAWAIALGEIDSWSDAVGSSAAETRDPNGYYLATMGPSMHGFVSSSAASPQSSSSGGGGGFSGGGGGGGGGGSW